MMRKSVGTIILLVGLVLGWAAPGAAATDEARLAAAYNAIFAPADQAKEAEPGVPAVQDAVSTPGENAPQPTSHLECFIDCSNQPGTYACCNRTAHPHCSCVSLAYEVPCDVYGFNPPSCSNG